MLIAGRRHPRRLAAEDAARAWLQAGKYYQTHGVANADFVRVGGADVEGTILPSGPVLVAAQLPDGNPIKKVALDYVTTVRGDANGAGTVATFGAHMYGTLGYCWARRSPSP